MPVIRSGANHGEAWWELPLVEEYKESLKTPFADVNNIAAGGLAGAGMGQGQIDCIAQTPAQEVLRLNPDGVFLSNGPGDPEMVPYTIDAVRGLLGKVPIFGICLGHQVLGLALGGEKYKLKFGHHGGNHPVMNLHTGKVEISVQNHWMYSISVFE